MTKIILNESEVRLAEYLGKARNQTARSHGVVDHQVSDEDPIRMDIEAVGAEIAFCKLMNVYPDLEVKPQSLTFDCSINGVPVDVKHTPHFNYNLIAGLNKKGSTTDVYVLMCGLSPKYFFQGWTSEEVLIQDKNIRNLGRGSVYFMDQNLLNHSLSDLRKHCGDHFLYA